jgi:hypothetical protein
MSLFKKNKSVTYPLMRDKEVTFNVIMSEKKVEIQSAAKDWTLAFTNGTFEYGMIAYLIKEDDMDAVHQLAQVSFLTRTMFHEAKLIKEFYKELDRYQKRMVREASEAAKKNPQSDAEILAEEKVLHEKTEESVKELEAIKSAKLSTKKTPK